MKVDLGLRELFYLFMGTINCNSIQAQVHLM